MGRVRLSGAGELGQTQALSSRKSLKGPRQGWA